MTELGGLAHFFVAASAGSTLDIHDFNMWLFERWSRAVRTVIWLNYRSFV